MLEKKGVLYYLHATKMLADAKEGHVAQLGIAEQMSKQRWPKVLPITHGRLTSFPHCPGPPG